ncbi:hypothetical protein [Aureivirga sp. CE67]|uniref:hypothetical protein n=1 Tax=Aureivirga sp. CE67 TaxID=1788983 RepID=UPI0018C9392A|nr:hypothetical protein [Aureivirga sp. CE67]
MQEEFRAFKKFQTVAEAKEVQKILEEQHIKSILTDDTPPVDVTFTGSTLQYSAIIKIKESDFKRAKEALKEYTESYMDSIDKDYYLFQFTDEELYDVLLKYDEWSELDYLLAQKILKERGRKVDLKLLNGLRNKRMLDLAKPEKSQKTWIAAGYIFSLLGGIFGLIIGYSLMNSKKTLPNGKRVFSYSDHDRKHGVKIFYLGIVMMFIIVMSQILMML